MRLIANFTKNTAPIPIDKSCELTNSYIHKCLGINNHYHDTFSSYSISSIQGGILKNGMLNFEEGMYIVISVPEKEQKFLSAIMTGILINPDFGFGMKFISFTPTEVDVHKYHDYVQTISPIILKDGRIRKTFKDDGFWEELTARTIKKLKHYDPDINVNGFKLSIADINNPNNKIKKIMVKGYVNKCSQVCMKIEGHKKTRMLLYDLGIGSSTGSGFGAIKVLN